MKVYGLPEGQGLDRRNDMAQAAFTVPEAYVSIVLSALAITRWTSNFEWLSRCFKLQVEINEQLAYFVG